MMKTNIPFFHNRRALIQLVVIIAMSGVILFALWSFALFRQLEQVTSQRALRKPAVFFTDIETLKTGMGMGPQALIRRLAERGYAESREEPAPEGHYRRLDDGSVDVAFREFPFPGEQSFSGLYRFTFDDNRLEGIEERAGGLELESILLEPAPLTGFSTDGPEDRPWISLDELPPPLIKSVLASEDRRFYQHAGVDFRSVGRAVWVNIRRRGVRQGGSTLTQQLVKNAFLTHKRTFRRKATEALLALVMEIKYDKREILEMYLNQIYLGRSGATSLYGVEDACRAYFGKSVSELTLAECALIAGIIPSPGAYNPRTAPNRALRRRERVLALLLENGSITKAEHLLATQEPLTLSQEVSEMTGNYYLAFVRELVEKEFGRAMLDFHGLRVYTAMDVRMQKAAERALAGQPLEGAVVALEPRTGFVKSLVGGRDFRTAPFNRAVLARRHPGSSFKPFVYAAALESGAVTLATLIDDTPLRLMEGGLVWEPRNYDGIFTGSTTVREAIVHSRNIPAVRVLQRTGIEQVVETTRALGIRSRLRAVPSLALGTSEVSPLELTAAYAPFANGGYAVTPLFIRTITDSEGNIIREYFPEIRQAVTAETASILTDALQDVINRGTGVNVRLAGFYAPCAGKTGTTDGFKDAWFIGYTPDLLCGVWLGKDHPASLERAAAELAVPVWTSFMKEACDQEHIPGFSRSSNIVELDIDPVTGLLARSGCPEKKREIFLKGTEPKRHCPLHVGGVKGFFKSFLKLF